MEGTTDMTTHVTTRNPVRSDSTSLADEPAARARPHGPSRTWALAGVGAGLAGIVTVVTSGMVGSVYDEDLIGDPSAIAADLADKTVPIVAFHTRRPGRRRPARRVRRRPAAPAPGPTRQRAPRSGGRLRRPGRHRRGLRARHRSRHRVHRGHRPGVHQPGQRGHVQPLGRHHPVVLGARRTRGARRVRRRARRRRAPLDRADQPRAGRPHRARSASRPCSTWPASPGRSGCWSWPSASSIGDKQFRGER